MGATVYGIVGDSEAATTGSLSRAFNAAARKAAMRCLRAGSIYIELRRASIGLTPKLSEVLSGTGYSVTGVSLMPEEDIESELREGTFGSSAHLTYWIGPDSEAKVPLVDVMPLLARRFTPDGTEPAADALNTFWRTNIDRDDFQESIRLCVKIPQ